MPKIKQLHADFLSIDLCINDNIWVQPLKSLETKISKIIDFIIKKFGLYNYNNSIELSILLTNDKEIEQLNFQYRQKNKPTNVLSFPAHLIDTSNLALTIPKNNILSLGDIVMSFNTIVREQLEQNIPFDNHFMHLLIHGVLHLLGFDHNTAQQADHMENLEIEILAQFGINSPYATQD
jgi:probable rRNA maturation factor